MFTPTKRQKPRPYADAVLICIYCAVKHFRNTLDGSGAPNTGLSPPPCGSRRLPFLPATANSVGANCAHCVSALRQKLRIASLLLLSPQSLLTLRGPHGGRFNARTQGQAYHYPGMRVVATSPPRLVMCPAAAPPLSSFLIAGSWPARLYTAFLFGPHIKRIQRTYSIFGCFQT